MKIEYRFVTGEKAAIEINGDFEEIILELDKEEYTCNRKETRRHKSLSLSDKSIENMSLSSDICDDVFKNIDKEKLHNAISLLKPDEQELLHKVYLDLDKINITKYANSLGVKPTVLWKRLERIRKKLKNILNKQRV